MTGRVKNVKAGGAQDARGFGISTKRAQVINHLYGFIKFTVIMGAMMTQGNRNCNVVRDKIKFDTSGLNELNLNGYVCNIFVS